MRDWLKKLRTDKGYTMKNMADMLGISESYYCTIENGERQKKMDLMLCTGIATIFGIPIAQIAEAEADRRGI